MNRSFQAVVLRFFGVRSPLFWITLFSVFGRDHALANWPVFYNAEKGPIHLSTSSAARPLETFTLEIPSWNRELQIPPTKINSAETIKLGMVNGLSVVEARILLKDTCYSDMLMFLKEITKGKFLPIYVQVYNRTVREPSSTLVVKKRNGLIITTGMDYFGTGHFHDRYRITISPKRNPSILASNH